MQVVAILFETVMVISCPVIKNGYILVAQSNRGGFARGIPDILTTDIKYVILNV